MPRSPSERWRAAASALAAESAADLTELRCVLPADVAAARLVNRAAAGDDASDATPLVAAAMALEFDEWPNAMTVGTLPPVEDVIPAVLDRIEAPHPRRSASSACRADPMMAARTPAERGDGRRPAHCSARPDEPGTRVVGEFLIRRPSDRQRIGAGVSGYVIK